MPFACFKSNCLNMNIMRNSCFSYTKSTIFNIIQYSHIAISFVIVYCYIKCCIWITDTVVSPDSKRIVKAIAATWHYLQHQNTANYVLYIRLRMGSTRELTSKVRGRLAGSSSALGYQHHCTVIEGDRSVIRMDSTFCGYYYTVSFSSTSSSLFLHFSFLSLLSTALFCFFSMFFIVYR